MIISLKVVSTNVGGIPEVLPTNLIRFSNPDEQGKKNNNIQVFSINI
jgi:hypothetical protein